MADPEMIPEDPKTPRPRNWVRWVLFASLALNLLVLGAVAGILLGGQKGPHRPAPSAALVRDLGLGPYLKSLSDEDRTAIRRTAEGRRGELREGRREMRTAFVETLEVLRSETLDLDRLTGLMQKQAQVADRGRQLGQQVLVAQIAQMSVEERRALAERLEKVVRRGLRHGKSRSKDRQ